MNLGYYETGCDNPFLPSYWKIEKEDLGWEGVVEAESFPFDPVSRAGFCNSFYLHCGLRLT